MRCKRIDKFRRLRRRKMRKFLVLGVIMPALLILLGYLAASVIILPSMSG